MPRAELMKPMRRQRFSAALAATLLAVAALLPACSSDHSEAPASSTAPAARFTNVPAALNEPKFVWSAAPGIDLETGVAVAVRGYYESCEMAQKTFDLRNVYPGFFRALTYVQPEISASREQDNNPGPFISPSRKIDGGDYQDQPLWGNMRVRILSITKPADDMQAIVCFNPDYVYVQLAASSYSVEYAKPHLWLERLDLSDHDPRSGAHPPASPTGPERGPLPAPLDVFGPGHVQGLSVLEGLPWNNPHGSSTKTTPGFED
jgi:hypothetical protein